MNQSIQTPHVLVLGSTGKIGSQVASLLIDSGHAVRLGARRPDAIAHATSERVQVVEFDYERPETFATAFAGVDVLFLLAPSSEHFSRPAIAALDAAIAAGVQHVVRYSALGASIDGTFPLSREHGKIDEALRARSVGWTILQPTFYQDNFITFQAEAIAHQDAFYGSSGDGAASYVASSDIAAVAARVLSAPTPHRGKSYVITGAEALSGNDVAQTLTKLLGRPIRFIDVGDEAMKASLAERGMPPWMAESMVGLEQVKRNGCASAITATVEQLLGRPPLRLEETLRKHLGQLKTAS